MPRILFSGLFWLVIVICFLLTLLTGVAAADDAPDIQQDITFGGVSDDVFQSVGICPEGTFLRDSYILVGYTHSQGAGGYDGWW